jgi:alpha-beta hydrolase superfamily lysophospholipase
LLVAATLLVAHAWESRSLPDLEPWHRLRPRSELTASEIAGLDLAGYLRREDEILTEVAARIVSATAPAAQVATNRYAANGLVNPRRFADDWNRTHELRPTGPPVGGVLLVHGLTDAPYSLRHLADLYRDAGYYALVLRIPGHGTVPAALRAARVEDWLAAVALGLRAVRSEVGADRALHLVGYSNGGALALSTAIARLDDSTLPRVSRLVLVSPMVAVSSWAAIAGVTSLLSVVPYFEKSAWLEVGPEYNPFKYQSFPVAAGYQSYRLTSRLAAQLDRLTSRGGLAALPPILTFQSMVDATVSTPAVVALHERLAASGPRGDQLVLFDLNRHAAVQAFLRPGEDSLAPVLTAGPRGYDLTVVSNLAPDDLAVAATRWSAGATVGERRPLGLVWPPDTFSLSHVALQFPLDDPLYGPEAAQPAAYGLALGRLAPRGERDMLLVSREQLMRAMANPFYPYLAARLGDWIVAPPAPGAAH